eukprot:Plantae.Rhodophyta-Rhodochaete_pulchella.ctg20233.p3 GENE.Plantae.Rhodophyta-Rhodochaete_pulchella.ctg20233~~Plantae.Rhodophyta-Rhodochaete_pulchella.ctg20233.p3  ORF type:complete len:108 (-),score=7.80 Plantae.Rhodophyta-Rhodochaete_pulchella.ctg20233:691-1014(-)
MSSGATSRWYLALIRDTYLIAYPSHVYIGKETTDRSRFDTRGFHRGKFTVIRILTEAMVANNIFDPDKPHQGMEEGCIGLAYDVQETCRVPQCVGREWNVTFIFVPL